MNKEKNVFFFIWQIHVYECRQFCYLITYKLVFTVSIRSIQMLFMCVCAVNFCADKKRGKINVITHRHTQTIGILSFIWIDNNWLYKFMRSILVIFCTFEPFAASSCLDNSIYLNELEFWKIIHFQPYFESIVFVLKEYMNIKFRFLQYEKNISMIQFS